MRVMSSPAASVAGAGDGPTPQVLVQNVGDAIAFVSLSAEPPPAVVLQPSEQITVAGLVRLLGRREPKHVPSRPAALVVALAGRLGRVVRPGRRGLPATGDDVVRAAAGAWLARRPVVGARGALGMEGAGDMSVPPRVAITGAFGFLGWHTACRLRATQAVEPVLLGREAFADPGALREALAEVDTVLHLAGVNRADSERAVEEGNVELARTLATALGERPVHVVFADSVQAELDNPYGRGKRRAAELLRELPGTLCDVVLPNLFGEHGRPAYNSFVATFCHEVAAGRRPQVTDDRQVPLLHAQDAAQVLIDAACLREDAVLRPAGEPHGIGEVLDRLVGFHGTYAGSGELPDLSTSFAVDLFNTYRSYLFPQQFPIAAAVHRDQRGDPVRDGEVARRDRTGVRVLHPARSHPRRPLPSAQGRAVLRDRGRGGDLPSSSPPRRRGDLPALGRAAVVRGHAHDVGAPHPQRRRG